MIQRPQRTWVQSWTLGPELQPHPCTWGDCSSLSAANWGDQRCLTALPYICKRSNSTGDQQPPDPPPTGGCPSGWSQFLNKVGGGEGAPGGEDVNTGRLSLRSPVSLATSKSWPLACTHHPLSCTAPVPGLDSLETKSV